MPKPPKFSLRSVLDALPERPQESAQRKEASPAPLVRAHAPAVPAAPAEATPPVAPAPYTRAEMAQAGHNAKARTLAAASDTEAQRRQLCALVQTLHRERRPLAAIALMNDLRGGHAAPARLAELKEIDARSAKLGYLTQVDGGRALAIANDLVRELGYDPRESDGPAEGAPGARVSVPSELSVREAVLAGDAGELFRKVAEARARGLLWAVPNAQA